MAEYIPSKYLPAGSSMISTSSECQAWRADISGGVKICNLVLHTGAFIVAVGMSGDAVIQATDIDGNDVSANIKAGYFLPTKTTFCAASVAAKGTAAVGGSIAMAYINPGFTQA